MNIHNAPVSRYTAREPEPSLPLASPYRLGAHLTQQGVDVAVFASHATAVEICFFDGFGPYASERRYSLAKAAHGVWTGHIPGIRAGQAYGYRVHGRWDPDSGLRHNPAKILLDPYARAITREPILHPALFSHSVDEHLNPEPGYSPDDRDSADVAALGVIVDEPGVVDHHPYTPWDKTVIYEAHVIGLTKQLPGIPDELRGTYAGVAHPVTIDYLKSLGITAIELLPIHAKMSEPFLTKQGKENYWGYSTLNFFAPEPSYAMQSSIDAGPQAVIAEVKGMVKLLHDAGLEVILDVVYNHTCEAGSDGPTVSFRGLDNSMYYRHSSARPGQLIDSTGTGNSLDFRRLPVIQLTLDSLRYWVEQIGVDGFRFDLAVTLARQGDSFNHQHPLYVAMATDPVLSRVKLINEPWDMGHGGWRTGQFPPPTADWNDGFRDTLRSFWITEPASIFSGGQGGDRRDLATRLAGSADLFGHGRTPGGRGVYASINFITAHDGFTMHDLTAYNHKHNEANGEDNRDGTDNNRSWNHGVEGPTDDPNILRARRTTMRNLFASLIFSGGTPMIAAGDEIMKTQHGNNNAYCQNNEISWLDWDLDEHQENMRDTVSYLLRLRRDHRVFRPKNFYMGAVAPGDSILDMAWLDNTGESFPDHKWFDPNVRLLQTLRSGFGQDADALIVINGNPESRVITLPEGRGNPFRLEWCSTWERPRRDAEVYAPRAVTRVDPLSFTLFFANPR
ncbi:glycogen debranching protein GlgX [Trueperella bialowiezensis]|uniref:Glycogen debranching enzyme n=1 Tax=Trueperella bialowiezensis TaxID=312285 RepID=A0A448PFU8_9ACTO|nr:glycogen debranching protein GlgX [Trueperella bialowiezensis]VEI13790.1 Glycogen debranching enzyme [Trueperella bialowiezensis]